MTLSTFLTSTWLAAIFFFQASVVPIWVPLIIILIVILIFWWGLTRNRIADEEEPAQEQVAFNADADAAERLATVALEEEADGSEGEGEEAVIDDEVQEVEAVVSAETEVEPPAAEAVEEVVSPPEPDDLRIIEGIGPKISVILADAGITTFDQLAITDVEALERIVRHEGGIRIANPGTWPQQAALAAAGDMEGLEDLQNKLVAGRHR